MEKLQKIIEEVVKEEKLISSVLSNLKNKDEDTFNKVNIKPVLIKNERCMQLSYEYKDKVIHKNLKDDEFIIKFKDLLLNHFKQAMIFTIDADYQVIISKKGKVSVLKKKPTKSRIDLNHNRKRNI